MEMRESSAYPQGNESSADMLAIWGDYHGAERILRDIGTSAWSLWQVDNGYLNRGHYDGYYSLSLNARQATASLWSTNHKQERFLSLHEQIQPWRTKGESILIAAPSRKQAAFLGFNVDEWASSVKKTCLLYTKRPVKVRIKTYDGATPLREVLRNESIFAVVGHSTKGMVEALLEGIPVFPLAPCVVDRMGTADLSRLDSPFYPDNRAQFFANLAYHQWTLAELAEGLPFPRVMR